MAIVYLLLGGNLGNRQQLSDEAKTWISKTVGKIICSSAQYESEAWGFEHPLPFLNSVLQVETNLQPTELLQECRKIELRLGRKHQQNKTTYEARTIDIDILFYNNSIILQPDLEIPHPRLHLRGFTLEPLCEIASQLVHPVFMKTIAELKEICTDKSWIKKIE